MAFDNNMLDSYGIETLKAIAKDMKKKLNLRDPLSKMSKDSLISFIANNANSGYSYEGELPEKGTHRAGRKPKSTGVRVESLNEAKETVPSGNAEQLALASGEPAPAATEPVQRGKVRHQTLELVDADNRPLGASEAAGTGGNARTLGRRRGARAWTTEAKAAEGDVATDTADTLVAAGERTAPARQEVGSDAPEAAELRPDSADEGGAKPRKTIRLGRRGHEALRPERAQVADETRSSREDRRQERSYGADDLRRPTRSEQRPERVYGSEDRRPVEREESGESGYGYRERRGSRFAGSEDSAYEERVSANLRSRSGRKGHREPERDYGQLSAYDDDYPASTARAGYAGGKYGSADFGYDEERGGREYPVRSGDRDEEQYDTGDSEFYDEGVYSRGRQRRFSPQDPYDEIERLEEEPYQQPLIKCVTGVLEIKPDGAGMLRGITFKERNSDVFVQAQIIKNVGLRVGDMVTGTVSSPKQGDSFFALREVLAVNGLDPAKAKRRPVFDQLVPIYPNEPYKLEYDPEELTTRIIDLFSPLGRGQRCLIVAPPKAGKTVMLRHIAMGIRANCKDAVMFALLVDERPEEVTDMMRSIEGTVVASTFDEPYEQHIRMSNLVLEHTRRLVELGKDVVIIMDSLTRLGRACNNNAPTSGRTMSGGLDISALRMPKHLFGSARNIENGGSLTIIATALVETGSKMDEVIFEEFKGTGNMEVNLNRKLAERRVFPAIDLPRTGTRHDELLYSSENDYFWFANTIRQQASVGLGENDYKQVEAVIKSMKAHPLGAEFNADYVARIKKNQQRKD